MTNREKLVACLNEALQLAKDGPTHHLGQLRYGGWANKATQVMASWLAIDPRIQMAISGIKGGWKMETMNLSRSEQIAHIADIMRKNYEDDFPDMPPGTHKQILLDCLDDIDWGELAAASLGKD